MTPSVADDEGKIAVLGVDSAAAQPSRAFELPEGDSYELHAQSGSIVVEGEWGTCRWSLDSVGKLLIGSGTGADAEMRFDEYGRIDASDSHPWKQYSEDIVSVVFEDGAVLPADSSYMFRGCSSLVSVDVSGVDVSQVQDMSFMFGFCSSLESFDGRGWDTSSLVSMVGMFSNCGGITSIDASGWDTSSVESICGIKGQGLFNGCASLATLDLSGWDLSSVRSMAGMFYGCSSLAHVDVSGWDTSSVASMSSMFYGCSSLESLDVSRWDTSSVESMIMMLAGCSSLSAIDVSGWDTSLACGRIAGSSAMGMDDMFQGCVLDEFRVGEGYVSYVGGGIPESTAEGGSWWSMSMGDWLTLAGVADRLGIVDTYLSSEPEGPDLSRDGWVDFSNGDKGYVRNGTLVKGWFDLGSSKYWFDSAGRMATGWTDVEVNGNQMHYYFNPNSGNLVRNTWFTIDGRKYYFRPSGNMATGWATISDGGVDKKYYFEPDGTLVAGCWRDIDTGQGYVGHYYFRPSGAMATGWATIDGEKYWFRPSGNMATGFADVDDAFKRYFDDQGHMATGWQQIGSSIYYFRASGAMQAGSATIDGKSYTFTDKGVLIR